MGGSGATRRGLAHFVCRLRPTPCREPASAQGLVVAKPPPWPCPLALTVAIAISCRACRAMCEGDPCVLFWPWNPIISMQGTPNTVRHPDALVQRRGHAGLTQGSHAGDLCPSSQLVAETVQGVMAQACLTHRKRQRRQRPAHLELRTRTPVVVQISQWPSACDSPSDDGSISTTAHAPCLPFSTDAERPLHVRTSHACIACQQDLRLLQL